LISLKNNDYRVLNIQHYLVVVVVVVFTYLFDAYEENKLVICQIDSWIKDGWMDGWMDGRTDGRMNGSN